jgi:hypothetical protein
MRYKPDPITQAYCSTKILSIIVSEQSGVPRADSAGKFATNEPRSGLQKDAFS